MQGPQHVGSEHPQAQNFRQIGAGLGLGFGRGLGLFEGHLLHGPQQVGSEHPHLQYFRHIIRLFGLEEETLKRESGNEFEDQF